MAGIDRTRDKISTSKVMKKTYWLALLTGLGILVSPHPARAETTAVVTGDRVNVRAQAALSGEVITQLRRGERVTVLEEINVPQAKEGEPAQWTRIALPANTPVWIHGEFVDPATKTITASRLNVRAGPGENFSVVARLDRGATVKEIRTVNQWMEIEPPQGAQAFVAANFLAKESAAPSEPAGPPAELAVTPPPPVPVPEEPPAPEDPIDPAPPLASEPAEAIADSSIPEPVIIEPEPAAEPVRRIVTREGVVRRNFSIQTPSYYALQSPETGRTMNYLHNTDPKYQLKHYVGFKVIISGEEALDRRWPNTPVLQVESIDLGF
jgi:uncharacterized protein YgiM (DUF1202 family)